MVKNGKSTFIVTAELKGYPREDSSINHEGTMQDKINNITLDLELDKSTAGNFLFKFSPSTFKYDKYQVVFRYDNGGKLSGIVFFDLDEDYVYIVSNMVELLTDIHQGYFKLETKEKIDSILDFDFDIGYDYNDDEIIDESGCS